MELHIVSSDELVMYEGKLARLWLGKTERGLVVAVLVATIAIPFDAPPSDIAAFERELGEKSVNDPDLTRSIEAAFAKIKQEIPQ